MKSALELALGTKFQNKLTILIFQTKFAQKEYFQSKTEKVNIAIELCIFELTPLIFEPNLLKNGISNLKQKNRSFACAHDHYLPH